MESSQLVEFMIERPEQRRIVGDIYKGKVTAILPGIQAAFLDIGMEKGAFLHVSDLAPNLDELELDDEEAESPARRHREPQRRVPIEDQIKKGDELLVQVMKEPIGTKGPRVTAQITLPGRFIVLMPGVDHIGVSRKIEDRAERARLRQIIQRHRPEGVGIIVRTVAMALLRSVAISSTERSSNRRRNTSHSASVKPNSTCARRACTACPSWDSTSMK